MKKEFDYVYDLADWLEKPLTKKQIIKLLIFNLVLLIIMIIINCG
jgi:hypothetical protein